MKLLELLKNTDITCENGQENIEISGVSYDSRKTQPGDLFVCVRGFQSDGHAFAAAAQKAGAAVIVAEEMLPDIGIPVILTKDGRKALSAVSANFFGRPSDQMLVFGVTGTNGKTTITYLMKAIADEWGKECGVLGTIAYVYGGQRFESINTSPESFELRVCLRRCIRNMIRISVRWKSLLTLWLFPAQRISLSITAYLPISRRIIWIFTRTLKIITMPRKNCFCRRQSAVSSISTILTGNVFSMS